MVWKLDCLPVSNDLESKKILKALPKAHAALAELKGIASSIPNQHILVNALALQEAKDSSAVENIITTHDQLYKAELNFESYQSLEAKEVQNYVAALKRGFDLVSHTGLLTEKSIISIQSVLEENNAGYRKLPGTSLKNASTGRVVYTPPQTIDEIKQLMRNLEDYINNPELQDVDPLIKLSVIHFQFESIHPFYDGNGRTGRIINILYLILQGLQTVPILYLSSYIIQNKTNYYRLLQEVRDSEKWEEWILYMLKGIETTAYSTIEKIYLIREQMQKMKILLRNNYKFYSQDLLNNLFKHPYTKIEHVSNDLGVSRVTASNYLNTLAKDGVLVKEKMGTANYFINQPLFNLLRKS